MRRRWPALVRRPFVARRHTCRAAGRPRRSRKSAGAIPLAAEAARRRRRLAASLACAIRDARVSAAGACRDGRRSKYVLLAAAPVGFERRPISRRAACPPKRTARRWEPDAGRGQASDGGRLAPRSLTRVEMPKSTVLNQGHEPQLIGSHWLTRQRWRVSTQNRRLAGVFAIVFARNHIAGGRVFLLESRSIPRFVRGNSDATRP